MASKPLLSAVKWLQNRKAVLVRSSLSSVVFKLTKWSNYLNIPKSLRQLSIASEIGQWPTRLQNKKAVLVRSSMSSVVELSNCPCCKVI